MATLKDISKATGLTISTVSDILNKREGSRYSKASREKVQEAAQKLGYDRNRLVRGMMKGKSNLIGIVLPDLDNPFYNTLLHIISPLLRSAGYSLLIQEVTPAASSDAESHALQELSEFRVEGIIAFPIHGSTHTKLFQRLANRGVVTAGLGLIGHQGDEFIDNIQINMEPGVRQACEALAKQGRQRIIFVGDFPWDHKLGYRWELLRDNFARLGLAEQPYLALPCEHNREGARKVFLEYLRSTKSEDQPDAVFTMNDNLAIGVSRAVADAGLQVPLDLAIVGYDNTELAAMMTPAISTIGLDLEVLGTHLVESLIARLNKSGEVPGSRQFETRFISRETA